MNRFSIRSAMLILSVLMIAACLRLEGKPSPSFKCYTIEYASPSFRGLGKTDATIKLEPFYTAQTFNSYAMRYRPEPFRLARYNYDRWIESPGTMVTEFLLRDLRASGLFQAVLSSRDSEGARFRLEGEVTEFFEDDELKTAAVIKLDVTLLDLGRGENERKVMFQKSYRCAEPCSKTAASLAKGMSRATALLSEKLILDVYHAMKQALESPTP